MASADDAHDLESQYDVLLQGSPFFDLTFTFTDREELPELGQEVYASGLAVNPGGIFNIASALSQLSLRVGLMAQLGNDMFSRFIVGRMEECGLPLDLVEQIDEPLPVVTVGVSFPHDRLFLSYVPPEGIRPHHRHITVADLDRYRPRAVFSYGELGHDVYHAARERDILTLVDTSWNPTYLRSEKLRQSLRQVNVVVPNEMEAREMTGASTAEEALEVLSRWCECVVIKRGSKGSIACRNDVHYVTAPIPVTAVETTGAGDNFNAGLLYGMLHDYPFEKSLRCANIAGALSTLTHGGCGGIKREILEDRLERTEQIEEEV